MIAIGVLALSAAQTRSSVDVYGTGRQTRALQLAQSRMETTRGVTFAAAVSDSGISDGFNWQTQVDTLGADMKTVRVVVSWTDHARPRSLRLDNLISDR